MIPSSERCSDGAKLSSLSESSRARKPPGPRTTSLPRNAFTVSSGVGAATGAAVVVADCASSVVAAFGEVVVGAWRSVPAAVSPSDGCSANNPTTSARPRTAAAAIGRRRSGGLGSGASTVRSLLAPRIESSNSTRTELLGAMGRNSRCHRGLAEWQRSKVHHLTSSPSLRVRQVDRHDAVFGIEQEEILIRVEHVRPGAKILGYLKRFDRAANKIGNDDAVVTHTH